MSAPIKEAKPKRKFLSNILTVFNVNNQTNKITGFSWSYIFLFLLQILVMVIEFAQIFSIGIVLEGLAKLNQGYSYTEFVKITLLCISLGFAQSFVSQFLAYREDILTEYTYQKLFKSGINKVLNYNLQWQETLNAGNKATMLREGSVSLSRSLVMLPQIFILGVSVIITITYLSIVNIWLLPLGVTAIIISIGIALYTQPKIRSLRKETVKIYENREGKLFEAFNNIHILKSSGAIHNILSPIYNLFAQVLVLEKQFISLMILRNLALAAVIQIINTLYVLYGGYLILIGAVSFGVMYAGYRYLGRLSEGVNRFTRLTIEIGLMEVKGARFYDIYNLDVNDNFRGVVSLENQSVQSINIKDLNFNYGATTESANQLTNISMSIPSGQKIGLVGTTGSGKSTLVKLLSGLYPINSGSIEIVTPDQTINFYDQTLDTWHNKQFLVAQDPELFNATLLENITLFDPSFSQDLLDQAVAISQLTTVIDELPKGLQTLIGEKGYKLSGGQRQRIGIARAMYKNTDIICFDESTSALDSQTEQDFQSALEKIWDEKTLIFIAHRLSTLKNVDIIYVFESGQIIEQGSFKQLVDKNGKFNQLWELQQKELI